MRSRTVSLSLAGWGSVESVFIALLVAATTVPVPEATAATLLYRATTYWLPLCFGACAVIASQVRSVGSSNIRERRSPEAKSIPCCRSRAVFGTIS
ncbi:hypothetical protein [Halostagnicola bangensis]